MRLGLRSTLPWHCASMLLPLPYRRFYLLSHAILDRRILFVKSLVSYLVRLVCLKSVLKIERVSNIISDTFAAFKSTNSRAAIHRHHILVCSMVTVSGTQVLQRHKPCLDAILGHAHISLAHSHWSARKITCRVGLLLGDD